MRRAPVKSRRTTLTLGWVFLLLGFWFLWSAYEGRGGKKPWLLGPILPW